MLTLPRLSNVKTSQAQSAGAVEYTASLQRGKTHPMSVLIYDTKQSDGEAPVILEL